MRSGDSEETAGDEPLPIYEISDADADERFHLGLQGFPDPADSFPWHTNSGDRGRDGHVFTSQASIASASGSYSFAEEDGESRGKVSLCEEIVGRSMSFRDDRQLLDPEELESDPLEEEEQLLERRRHMKKL